MNPEQDRLISSVLKAAASFVFMFLATVTMQGAGAATTTPDIIPPENATTTDDVATTTDESALPSSEDPALNEPLQEEMEEGQVLGEEAASPEDPPESEALPKEEAEEDIEQEEESAPDEANEEDEAMPEEDGPVLGEGAGESRSPARFIAAEEDGADIPARAVTGIEFDPDAAHSCIAKTFSISIAGDGEAAGYVSISGDPTRMSLGSLAVGSLPEGIDVRFAASDDHELEVSPEGQEAGIRVARGRNAQKGSFMVPIAYSLSMNGASSTVACQINIVNQ